MKKEKVKFKIDNQTTVTSLFKIGDLIQPSAYSYFNLKKIYPDVKRCWGIVTDIIYSEDRYIYKILVSRIGGGYIKVQYSENNLELV